MEFQRNIQSLVNLAKAIPLNFFDLALFFAFFVYVYEEYSLGLIPSLVNLFSMIGSFVLGLILYSRISSTLFGLFSLSKGFSDAISFLLVSAVFYFLISNMLSYLFKRSEIKIPIKFSRIGGAVSGAFSFFLVSAFIISLLLSFPVSPLIKSQIRSSYFGKYFFTYTQNLEQIEKNVFGGAISDTLNFMTVKPDEGTTIALHFQTNNVSVDTFSEGRMLTLVNNERSKRGLSILRVDTKLREAGRAHAKDMFERGYFSHYTLEGLSPFDRLEKYNVKYTTAAENLAYAPDVDLAFTGLMNSEGHKRNILDPSFNKIGIGVIDGGIYGKMFVQEFTD